MAHNGGKVQVNLDFPYPYTDPWALNLCKMALHTWQASGASDNNWPTLLSDNGYPTAMPSGGGATWRSSQLWMPGVVGNTYVLDWTGSASLALTNAGTGGSITESIVSSTRREYTIASGPPVTNFADGSSAPVFLVLVTISAMSTALTSVRLYNKAYENLLAGSDATAIFDPDFLTRVRQFGVLRFMQWHQCNTTRLYNWADRHVEADFNWAGDFLRGSLWYGTATQSLNKQTISALGTLTHGKIYQFYMPARPVNKVITATTVGNPTQFTITGHGFTTGDKVGSDQDANGGGSFASVMNAKSSSTGLPPEYTVTVVDPDTITINLNSTGFAAPSGTFRLIPQMQISDGTTTKRCLRNGMTNYFNSEFSTYASGGQMTAVYDANFDVFVLSGNGSGNVLDLGLPYTAMISLANYCGTHPWFNLNYMATDDHWTQLVTLCHSTLNSGLIPRFEVGNEIWNTGTSFWQTAYAASNAARLYGSASVDLGYSGRVAQVSDLIKAVYGSGTDWQMVMGVQGVSSVSTNRFQGNATINGGQSSGYPLNKCDLVAFAPYVIPPFCYTSNSMTYTGLADAVDNYNQGSTSTAYDWLLTELTTPTNNAFNAANSDQALDGWIAIYTPRWTTAIGSYTGRNTLSVHHYEGGIGIPGPGDGNSGTYGIGGTSASYPVTATSGRTITLANVQSFYYDFLQSAQASKLMQNYLRQSINAGVRFPSQFTVASSWAKTGTWGAYRLNSFSASSTKQYDVMKLVNNGKRRFFVTT